jgi:transcriptional regulator with XRE-family HTH domain
MNKYITVSEFCKLTGVSKQRVSQLINGLRKIKPRYKQGADYKWRKGRLLINADLVSNYLKR